MVVGGGGGAVVVGGGGGAVVLGAGGAAVVVAGGAGSVVVAGPPVVPGAAVVLTGACGVVVAGSVVVGAAGQVNPAMSASVIMPPIFRVFQPQTRLFHRGQAQSDVTAPQLLAPDWMSSPLAHLYTHFFLPLELNPQVTSTPRIRVSFIDS